MDALGDLQEALDGRYEVLRELGRGGMAVVYLARDLKHDREVAIKELRPEMATAVGAERFVREIRTAARLSHPNILPLHDSIAVGAVRAYVMPYVQGETLRQRLDRERQLGIGEAVDIARQVAAGLDYAHAHGVVHRDIKPENILLTGDQAMIADFGLARALFTAASVASTQSGIAVGTPAYMSPEQAAADRSIDGRTDVYSLGCMVFEMVAGVTPFRGATAAALMAAHATRTPPSLCAERASCPEPLDAAVRKALAKVPADRFHTAGEFVRALDGARPTPLTTPVVGSRTAWLPWAAGGAIVVVLAVLAPAVKERIALARVPIDSARILMLPVSGTSGRQVTTALARQRLTSALMEWRDLRVVEPPPGKTHGSASNQGVQLARGVGASRFLAITSTPMGDSVELRTTLYDARGDPVRQRTLRVSDDLRSGPERYRALVASLLRSSDGEDGEDDASPGTTRVAAWRAFTRGDSLRRAWALPEAEGEFRRALALDPGFARAHLWLAQVISWDRPQRGREWGDEARRALAAIERLHARDSLLTLGLNALASARYPEACRIYEQARRDEPRSDLPWYGRAYCLALDPLVVPSRHTPSGWAFRGDVNSAVAALDSGIAASSGSPAFAFRMLGLLLITEPLQARHGRSASPNAGEYRAFPSILGDTLAWIPYPAAKVERGAAAYASTREAYRRTLRHLDASYQTWVIRAPRSAEALSALAYVQELQGQPDALSTVAKANASSASPSEKLHLSVMAIRLLVKQEQFAEARAKAESLLAGAAGAHATDLPILAGVAALIGNVPRAADLLARASEEHADEIFQSPFPLPPPVARTASEFLALASSGICTDSLRAYVDRLGRELEQYVPAVEREVVRRATLVRPLGLAVPCLGPRVVLGLPDTDRLIRMQQALAVGNTASVRVAFDSLREARRVMRPGDVALDHTVQEAWLLLAMHDTVAAIRYLDLPLTALSTLNTHFLEDVPAAAALGRALRLRIQLAKAVSDTTTAARLLTLLSSLQSGARVRQDTLHQSRVVPAPESRLPTANR